MTPKLKNRKMICNYSTHCYVHVVAQTSDAQLCPCVGLSPSLQVRELPASAGNTLPPAGLRWGAVGCSLGSAVQVAAPLPDSSVLGTQLSQGVTPMHK